MESSAPSSFKDRRYLAFGKSFRNSNANLTALPDCRLLQRRLLFVQAVRVMKETSSCLLLLRRSSILWIREMTSQNTEVDQEKSRVRLGKVLLRVRG